MVGCWTAASSASKWRAMDDLRVLRGVSGGVEEIVGVKGDGDRGQGQGVARVEGGRSKEGGQGRGGFLM